MGSRIRYSIEIYSILVAGQLTMFAMQLASSLPGFTGFPSAPRMSLRPDLVKSQLKKSGSDEETSRVHGGLPAANLSQTVAPRPQYGARHTVRSRKHSQQ